MKNTEASKNMFSYIKHKLLYEDIHILIITLVVGFSIPILMLFFCSLVTVLTNNYYFLSYGAWGLFLYIVLCFVVCSIRVVRHFVKDYKKFKGGQMTFE